MHLNTMISRRRLRSVSPKPVRGTSRISGPRASVVALRPDAQPDRPIARSESVP